MSREEPGSLSVDWVDTTTAEVTSSGSAVRVRPREDSSLVCFTPTEPISDARSVVVECPRNLRLEGQTPENLEGETLPVTLLLGQSAREVVVASALSELKVVVESTGMPDIRRVIAFERDSLLGLERLTICRGHWLIRHQGHATSSEPVDLELRCRLTDSESADVLFVDGCRVRISRLEADAGHIDLRDAHFAAGIEIVQPMLSLGISQEITDASIECRVLELQSRPSNSRIVAHEKLTLAHGADSCDIQANRDAVLSGCISNSSVRVSGETTAYALRYPSSSGHCSLEDSRSVDFAGDVTLSKLTVSSGVAAAADAADPRSSTASGKGPDSSSEVISLSFKGGLTVEGDIHIESAALAAGDRLSRRRSGCSAAAGPGTSESEHAVSVGSSLEVGGDVHLTSVNLACGSADIKGNLYADSLGSGVGGGSIRLVCPGILKVSGDVRVGDEIGTREEPIGHLEVGGSIECRKLRVAGSAHVHSFSYDRPDPCAITWKPEGNSEFAVHEVPPLLAFIVETPSVAADDVVPVLCLPFRTLVKSLEVRSGCLELTTRPDSGDLGNRYPDRTHSLEIAQLTTATESHVITGEQAYKFKLVQDGSDSTNIVMRGAAAIEVEVDLFDSVDVRTFKSGKPDGLRRLNITEQTAVGEQRGAGASVYVYSTDRSDPGLSRSEISASVTGLVTLRIDRLIVTELDARLSGAAVADSRSEMSETESPRKAGFPTLQVDTSGLVRIASGAAHIIAHEGRITGKYDDPLIIKSFEGGSGYINRVDPRDIPYEEIDLLDQLRVFTPAVKSIKRWRRDLLKSAMREYSFRENAALLVSVLRKLHYPTAASVEARIIVEEKTQNFRKLLPIVRRRGIDGRANAELSWTLYRLRHFAVPARWSFQNLYFWVLRSLGYGCRPIVPFITWFMVSVAYAASVYINPSDAQSNPIPIENAGQAFTTLLIPLIDVVHHMLLLPLQITSLAEANLLEIAASVWAKLAVVAFASALAKYRVFSDRRSVM